MHSFTCVSVVVYVARKLRPCPSYSRRRDRINLVLWRSLDKGGGGALAYHGSYHNGEHWTQFVHFQKLRWTPEPLISRVLASAPYFKLVIWTAVTAPFAEYADSNMASGHPWGRALRGQLPTHPTKVLCKTKTRTNINLVEWTQPRTRKVIAGGTISALQCI